MTAIPARTIRIQIQIPPLNLNLLSKKTGLASEKTEATPPRTVSFPLGLILKACPDIAMYTRHGIRNWQDLVATASLVRSAPGVSPSAWEGPLRRWARSMRRLQSRPSCNAQRKSRVLVAIYEA